MLQAYDQPNGQSTRSDLYAQQFANAGHTVFLFCNAFCLFRRKYVVEVRGNHHVEEINGYSAVWLASIRFSTAVGRALNMIENCIRILVASFRIKQKPDVLIVPSVPPTTALAGLILSWRFRAKLVYEIRDVWPEALIDSGAISRHGFTAFVFRTIEKLAYMKANFIVSTLDEVHEHVARVNPDTSIHIFPNGFMPPITCGKSFLDLQEKYDLPDRPTGKLAMYVGGFGIDHDVMAILDAAELLGEDSGIQFWLFGSGQNREKMERHAQDRRLRYVTMFDPVDKEDVIPLQKEADVLLAAISDSPTYRFGLNLNKVVYYLATGVPIAFSGNKTPKFFMDYKIGFTCRYNDVKAFAGNINVACGMTMSERDEIRRQSNMVLRSELDMDRLGRLYSKKLIQLFEEEGSRWKNEKEKK